MLGTKCNVLPLRRSSAGPVLLAQEIREKSQVVPLGAGNWLSDESSDGLH